MKKIILILTTAVLTVNIYGQTDKELVKKAGLNYIEGFYEGDTVKLKICLKETLNKFGFWRDKDSDNYGKPIYMSYKQALEYAKRVKEKEEYPKEDAPKVVEVLDVMEKIAVVKITAWWGYDYMLLSKTGDKWMIEQVIWQGPLSK